MHLLHGSVLLFHGGFFYTFFLSKMGPVTNVLPRKISVTKEEGTFTVQFLNSSWSAVFAKLLL